MSYKVTKVDRKTQTQVNVKTKKESNGPLRGYNWWAADDKETLKNQIIDTAAFLKENQQYRFRQASIHARLYGNVPLANYVGSTLTRLSGANNLPVDRPTMNVIQSCIDTLVSRLTQAKPRPVYLTDNADYRNRLLSKQMNTFIGGEFYQTKAYEHGERALRLAATLGTGCIKVLRSPDDKVALESTLLTEIFVDNNDAFYGKPRSMYQLKLVDRSVLLEIFPEYKSQIAQSEQAYPDDSGESQKTIADQIMLVEAWHLPSSAKAKDGRHTISCTAGIILDEEYTKEDFPFVFLHYSPRLAGFWAQGLSEQLTGTQIEINKLLVTISQSINLVGVPRIFVEDGSKVVKAHLNNSIGSIVTYRGTKPEYEVAPCVPQELYAQLQRLVEYAYQQSGISSLAATSQKPAGIDSGTALREYDDLQSDRFATLSKRYDAMYIDLAYKVIDIAIDIAEETGEYQTVYPNKDGTREICLPDIAKLKDDPFVLQCFDSSSLPRDPAGRIQTIVEWMQAGIISPDEGRRLMDFPDLDQENKLKFAAQERILQQLDNIVEKSKYDPPDPYTDLAKAKELVVQYYNLYASAKLEESKLELLRNYQSQVLMLEQASMPQPSAPGMPIQGQDAGTAPIGVPQAPPTSNLLPINQTA